MIFFLLKSYKGSIERMASSSYRVIKPDLKRYEKRRLYLSQSNYIIANEPQKSNKCYRIDLNFLADQNKSLIDIFLTYFDSIHEIKTNTMAKSPTRTLKYNQIFSLMVKNYFVCDLFLPKVVKSSEEDRMAHFQIIGFSNIQYMDQLTLNDQIRQLCELAKTEMQGKFKARLAEALRESNKGEEAKNYLRLDIINTILRQQKEKTIQYIMTIEDSTIKQIYIPKKMKDVQRLYLRKIIDSLLSFRFTKKLYRSLKFANFIEKRYKGYYNLNYLKQHGNSIRQRRQNKFIMKRYTNNHNQYLMNLYSLVKIRDKEQKYDCQMFQATKQLLKELISHNKMTKTTYPMLSPHAIIFNQLSLKVQLSFQNPLLQALGLLHKPVNIENTICHLATPAPYDTYANLSELNNPQLQTNHLIGINQILKDHYKVNALNSNTDFALQKSQAEQQSQSWRFMLTAHFLMHGKEYYRTAGALTFKRLQEFKLFVGKEEQKLKSPQKGYFNTILGQNLMKFASQKFDEKQYDSSLYFFDNLFNASQDSDSVIQQFGQIKINRYLKLFAQNIKQLLTITCHQFFSHVYNTIHHLLRFYLGIFLQISQIMLICGYFSKNKDIGLKLFEELADKISKDGLKKGSYVESSYGKFKEYKRRQNVRSETQYTYLKERYKEEYELIEELYEFNKSVKVKISQISGNKSNQRFNIDLNSNKEALVLELSTSLTAKLSKIRPTISALIYHQFFIPKQASTTSQKRSYLTTKLKLLTLLVLGLSHQNFITVQSIIMPALRNTEVMQDNNSLTNSVSDQRYIEQRELCDYCLQIMKEQTLQLGFDFQKNEGQRAGKQHGKVDEKGHSKDFSQNN